METPFGLGGQKREKDTRDYKVESLRGSGFPSPESYSSPVTTIYMQDKYPTCGAHAGAQLANVLFGATTSPKFLWKIIKSIDGFALEAGTDMTSIFKALQKVGICSLSLLDNSLEDSLYSYSRLGELTREMYTDAATKRIGTYAFTNRPTFQQIKDAVYLHKAAILLVDCGDGWYTPDWMDNHVNPLHVGKFVGHHFICATQYGMTLIDGPNSWSAEWGKQGMFNFNSIFLPHVLEMGVATLPVPEIPSEPAYQPYVFKNNMFFGLLGNADVHQLQIRLGVTPATGNFGPLTLMAVLKYQREHNIPATGFVGILTRTSLNQPA